MSHRLHSLLIAAASLLLAVAIGACSDSNSGGLNVTPELRYQAGFYLSVGSLNPDSRTPAGDYDPGAGIENFIDLDKPGNVRVVLYDTDGTFRGEITNFIIEPIGTTDTSKRYHLLGSTDVDISSGKFKVMVLANWPSYPSDLSLSAVWAQQFDFDGRQPAPDNLIPLYGIKDINLPAIEPGVAANLGTIHLIRALAKIEVVLDDPSDFWHFSKLELTNYNTKGLCAPAVSSQSEYVKDRWDRDYIGRPFLPEGVTQASDLPFVRIDDKHYVLYVPEYDNNHKDMPEARIRVDFEESIIGERYISFDSQNHASLQRGNLERNLWYKIIIKKKPEETDVEWTVDVIPYALVDLEPNFGTIPSEAEVPATLFLVGTVGNTTYDGTTGLEMTKVGSSFTRTLTLKEGNEFYFAINRSTEAKPDAFTAPGNRIAPRYDAVISEKNTLFLIHTDTPGKVSLLKGMEEAKYTLTLDWTKMELSLVKAQEQQ
ncbi:MAG: hypothetical protein NC418_10190 [Muribaculaceae bacterium]|nr:hypothetical protein [Muribaculaceae bacterium]